ncbi:OmpA family protein [Hymenobacter sp.]|uniref:OmpA family protein n=1 Tax=Hymenobacter sp. TaxID=1898978 RepID=UPI00286A93CB|nr:OmpA family protein [Hymenobacter sp.]
MKRSIPALALMGCFVSASPFAHAQNPAMSLVGSVQSDEKKPLPGAAITVVHMPSGVRHTAASDGAGRFVIGNLTAGGPYFIRVGEGGYRPQTVENIFLENGKTASFTVTLSKLDPGAAKDRNDRTREPNGSTLTLADEAVVGGPVLLTTTLKTSPRQAAAPVPASSVRPAPASPAVPAPTPASPAPAAQAPTAARYPKYVRYPGYTPVVRRVSDPIVPGRYDGKSGNYIYDTGNPTTLKLPNGDVVPGVGVNSTESYLHHFLADPQMQVDTVDLTKGWYNFDRVYFDAGKATLTAESVGQLRNIAALLRAYPKSRIKLGGYTDSTGSYKVNKLLSDARARTAWAALVDMGISPSRVDARGYGPRYTIASNSTDEGRAKNRRLSVKVVQK